jgi:hypothetical protein
MRRAASTPPRRMPEPDQPKGLDLGRAVTPRVVGGLRHAGGPTAPGRGVGP